MSNLRVTSLRGRTAGVSPTLPDGAVVTGVAATFTGVLTYEDVTNIDSVGIVTARTGIKVLAGGINIVGGGATVAGIATFHDGADIEGFKIEDGQTAATPNGEFNFYLASGHFLDILEHQEQIIIQTLNIVHQSI